MGYMVKAFSDYHTVEARVNYEYRRDAILAAGTHMISTDYPSGWKSDIFDSVYSVNLDEHYSPVICNIIMTNELECSNIYDFTDYEFDLGESNFLI